ncbi:MAG: glycoside hydrolase family 3 C-terminal domain-containing protein [Saprospiraceae bacterium]|nr:glycoside hydrolase family 3 C-terminal domain-containing protein [Saprospiraceae bacterium]
MTTKSSIYLTALTVFLLFSHSTRAQHTPPQLTDKASIEAVVAAMTLPEKAALVVGGNKDVLQQVNEEIIGAQSDRVPGAAGQTQAVPRLGIPSIVLADGPMGVRINATREGDDRTYYATKFPSPNVLASSWDTALVRKVGWATGRELKAYGIDLLLAPGMNIQTYLLNGRNYEYFSEDPLLTGIMATAHVKGVQANGVGATIKHFTAFNQRANNTVNAIIRQRALREIYLRGFKIAVKQASPWALMDAYNKINGVWATENEELLTDVLREEWGFDGFTMTDWEFTPRDEAQQMRAGTNLLMPGREEQQKAIIEAVETGKLDEAVLDRRVSEILGIIIRTPTFKGHTPSGDPDLDLHARIAREAAADGMILLKNEGDALPVSSANRLAIFGTPHIETMTGGRGSALVSARYAVGIPEGLKTAGYQLDEDLRKRYRNYVDSLRATEEYEKTEGDFFVSTYPKLPEMDIAKEARIAAESSDLGLILLASEHGTYGSDRSLEDFYLSESHQKMIADVSQAFKKAGKPVVVILNTEGPLEIASWKDKVDAILLAWQPGQELGHALADVLTGRVNPSGKLPQTLPADYRDLPYADRYPGKPEAFEYTEDIYVGYRYHSTFQVDPVYEFGYGLSYTTFEYTALEIEHTPFDGKANISVTVKNAGDRPGREVVQLYVEAPEGGLENPALELKAFGKTRELLPGDAQTLHFELDAQTLASFDPNRSAWILQKGSYAVLAGASSEDIRQTTTFTVGDEIVVEEVRDVLAPEKEIEVLSRSN